MLFFRLTGLRVSGGGSPVSVSHFSGGVVGITGVHHCAWLCISSWDSNWDPRAYSVNASPSALSPHPIRPSKQGPALISKQHSGPVLEATGLPCFVSLKLFSHHTFNICLLSLSPIPRDSGFSVPRCCLAHGVNTVKPDRVVMDRGSMRGLLSGVHHQARDNENCEVSQTGDSEHQPA